MKYMVLLCLLISFASCTPIKAAIAMKKSTEHFIPLKQDSRVLYEKGSEEFAAQISKQLDAGIQDVERGQYSHFSKPVTVYVCNTVESFTSYCLQKKAAGCVANERLFLSPISNQKDRNVLTHELSHLHLEQQLGMLDWHSGSPAWLQEGLAVLVSNDEGAKKVSRVRASQAIATGRTFRPNTSGSLIFKKTAHSFNLDPYMFYKQAGMFVGFLREVDEEKFKIFILGLAAGQAFEPAFVGAYHQPIDVLWGEFVQFHKQLEQKRHT